MGKRIRSYIPVIAIVLLAVFYGKAAKAQTAADLAGVKRAVITAYKNYQKQVNVSSFHLYNGRDTKALNALMSEVVNETPGLFYAGQRFTKLVAPGSGQIRAMELSYGSAFMGGGKINTQKIKTTQKKINAKVKQILQVVKPGMSKVEKALVLHDYLVQNTAYCDDENKEYSLSEWGVFLKGKANCQGYSLAYGILLKQVGIPVRYVTSEKMMHMWTMIKLGGAWYHVDVTWDDPLDTMRKKDQYGLVMHDMFLCSSAKMKKNGYYGFSAPRKAASKKYDKKYWNQVTSAFVYRGGKWLYQTGEAICQRNALTGGKAKVLYRAGGHSFVSMNRDKYYFINNNRIYLYNRKNNHITLVLDGAAKYRNQYAITQLKYTSGKLTYRMFRGTKRKTVTKKVKRNGLLKK